MFKKKIYILIISILLISIDNITFANDFDINIKKMVKERNENITLTKVGYLYTDNYIKRNFYGNLESLKNIKEDIDSLNLRKDIKYIIYGILKTESNFTNKGGIKSKEYYKSNGGYIGNLYVKCIDNTKLPIYVEKNGQDISLSVYHYYNNKRKGWFSQFIAFCKLRSYLKTQKEKEFLDNWKTSYAGAIGVFQFLPLNIVKKFNLTPKDLKDGKIFKLSFYIDSIYKFLQLQNFTYNFKSPQDLKKCNNYYSRKFPECKDLRERIFWYNKSTKYINTVINNAVKLWEMDESGLFTSPIDDMYIKDDISNYIIKINNPQTMITQTYSFLHNRWHPAIDITPILYGIKSKADKINFYKKNDVNIIWNSNKKANCYFLPYDKENGFLKRTGNTIVCITKDGKYLSLYTHLRGFNKNILNKGVVYTNNNNIIAGWLNGMLNYPGNISPFNKNYKFKKVIKIQNISAGDVLGYLGNVGHSTGPHLHYVYVKILKSNRISVLPLSLFNVLNNIKLY